MFGLSRIIAIGLVTLAVGGVMFVARPFDPPEGTRPGAEAAADPAAPVEFTGTGTQGACEVPATTDAEGPVAHTRGASCGPTYTFSDERLDGTVTWSSNVDEYVGGSGLVI